MFNYTNQPLKSAIVPLQIGHIPTYNQPYGPRTAWTPRGDSERGMMEQWEAIYGVYSFASAEHGGDLQWVEASMLITNWLHDFCGGQMVSSARVYSCSLDDEYYTSYWGKVGGETVLGRAPEMFSTRKAVAAANVPMLQNALRTKRPLTRPEVYDIMSRSLMAAALSFLYAHGKRGLIAFDRADSEERESWTRHVLSHATSLRCVPTQPFERNPAIAERFPIVAMAHQDAKVTELLDIKSPFIFGGPRWLMPMDVGLQHCNTWHNHNSGNTVGPIQVYFATGELVESDEDLQWREAYDEDLDDYYYEPLDNRLDEVKLPEWYSSCADTVGYARLWPCSLFSNG